MKDHLNVTINGRNGNVYGNHFLNTPSKPGKINVSNVSDSTPDAAKSNGANQLSPVNYDVFEDMDFSKAMEFSSFIREQASIPDGRQQMGLAHQSISPEQVTRLF